METKEKEITKKVITKEIKKAPVDNGSIKIGYTFYKEKKSH